MGHLQDTLVGPGHWGPCYSKLTLHVAKGQPKSVFHIAEAQQELPSIRAQSGNQLGSSCALPMAMEGGSPPERRRSGQTERKPVTATDVESCLACTQLEAGPIVNLHCCLLDASPVKEVQTPKAGPCACRSGGFCGTLL